MPVSSIERLQTLYGVSLALSSELDLQALLPEVIDQVIAVTGAERGFLMLGGGKDDLVFHVARGLDQATIESPEFEVSRGVVEKVADSGEPVRSLDAQTEGWLAERKSIHQLKLRSLMCVPLKAKGRSIGLVYVDNRMQAGIFTPDDLALLEAVASSAAVAIENARLYSLAVQQARMERELELASELQAALIPARAPSIPGLELAGQWHAALEVAGDFYDFIPLSNGRLVVVIGDVTDKGVPAAFFMGLSRTTLRASLAADLSLSQAIEQANRLLCADSSGGMFVTLFAISLDPQQWQVETVCAGHNPPLLVRPGSKTAEELPGGGMPLGIEESQAYPATTIEFEPGTFLLLYTDGVPDAVNGSGEFYGLARLQKLVPKAGRQGPEKALAMIHADVLAFADGQAPYDDLTLVGLRRV